MSKLSKSKFILLSIVMLILMIVSGAFLPILLQLFLTSIFFLFSSFYLLNKSPFSNRVSLLVIFAPILLLYAGGYIYDLIHEDGFIGKPFFWSYLLIFVLVYLSKMYKISEKKIVYFFIPFCFLLTVYVYCTDINNEKGKIETSQLETVKFVDEFGNNHDINEFKGKLTLFEFWTTACSQCPESIAKFHELSNQYKSNKNVDFRVVNINLGKQHNEKIFKKLESEIKLKKLYTNKDIFKQLNFNAAPSILILNARGDVVYFGYPNFRKLTQHYLPSIVKNELSKM